MYHALQTLLDALFTVIVLGVCLFSSFVTGFIAASVGVLVSSFYFSERLSRSAHALQESRNNLASQMLRAWDNVLVGNSCNLERWRDRYKSALN